MSTFQGHMPEFPEIRVDFFRLVEGSRRPLACFLSHVHSDHLVGLESFKSPFIYCSAATREILLRLERYPHRINFELGILESRKQHYKHLKNLLKPLPLETPTRIELAPDNEIQVTLFDANHCTGAVMFLIEGVGNAVLYTGDVRSEPWFVNALTRNPLLIEYTSNHKTLDCIYLDTSFTDDTAFPSKAEGLSELLHKVAEYPPDTTFHFTSWTFGYEDVWIALSRALGSPIHVSKYILNIYESLRGDSAGASNPPGAYIAREGPILTGYKFANTENPGILTLDRNVKLHSCEKGINCSHLDEKTVWIRPIITRTASGQEISDIGVGGGAGDLTQTPELELDNDKVVEHLLAALPDTDFSVLCDLRRMLLAGLHSTRKSLLLSDILFKNGDGRQLLEELVPALVRIMAQKRAKHRVLTTQNKETYLPRVVTFPYSRHSSYAEQRDLVKAFRPLDVYPCTVDKANWHEGVSVRFLFGDICSAEIFRHDREIREAKLEQDQVDTEDSWIASNMEITQRDVSSSDEDNSQVSDLNRLHAHSTIRKSLETIVKSRSPQDAVWTQSEECLLSSGKNDHTGFRNIGKAISQRTTPSETIATETGPPISLSRSEARNLRRKKLFGLCDHNIMKRACLNASNSDDGSSASSVDPSCDVGFTSSNDDSSSPKSSTIAGLSYYDAEDEVYRCQGCGWEVWSPSGECVGCGKGDPAYYEYTGNSFEAQTSEQDQISSSMKRRDFYPGIRWSLDGPNVDIDSETREDLTGIYLDGVSAYDTESNAEDKYEIDSFIDDSPIHDEDMNEDHTSDDDRDFRCLYEHLSAAYNMLEQDHVELIGAHEELRRDYLGSDYSDQIIDIDMRDPPVSEVVLSELSGDSQSSEISMTRVRTRIDAFLAADRGAWHGVSLMSTGDNHTAEDVEL